MKESRSAIRDETGTALLLAIVLVTVLGVIGAVVALTARMEVLIAGAFHQTRAALYAADGALSRALLDLSSAQEWSTALTGIPSSFTHGDPQQRIEAPGVGSMLLCCGFGSVSAAVQQAATAGRTWGDNTPRWTLYGWGPASAWRPEGTPSSPYYVAIWVADDAADGDGDPSADTNHRLDVYAIALGPGGGRRAVRAAITRPADSGGKPVIPGVQLVSWHETRW